VLVRAAPDPEPDPYPDESVLVRAAHASIKNLKALGKFLGHRYQTFTLIGINIWLLIKVIKTLQASVADPDPPYPRVFGPPGSGSTSQRYGSGSGSCSGSGSFHHHAKIVRKTLIPTI
jgi:hypothetical protein